MQNLKIAFIIPILELLIIIIPAIIISFFDYLFALFFLMPLLLACIEYFKTQKTLNYILHKDFLNLYRIKKDEDFIKHIEKLIHEKKILPINREDIIALKKHMAFCAFITHPNTRIGLRALIGCGLLIALVANDVDFLILHAVIAVLFLFGICKIVQGAMDVV